MAARSKAGPHEAREGSKRRGKVRQGSGAQGRIGAQHRSRQRNTGQGKAAQSSLGKQKKEQDRDSANFGQCSAGKAG